MAKQDEETKDVSQTSEDETRQEEQPEANAQSDSDADQKDTSSQRNPDDTEPTDAGEANQDDGEDVDYKEKFANSTRENQKIRQEKQELLEELNDVKSQVEKFTSEDIPTDDELVEKYPNFNDLQEHEKDNIRRTVAANRKMTRVAQTVEGAVGSQERMDEAKEKVDSDDRLAEHQEEFIAYATQDENQGTNLDTLANSFLYQKQESEDTEGTKKNRKDPALQTGTAPMDKQPSGSNTITSEEARQLRKNNPREYEETVVKGNVEIVKE